MEREVWGEPGERVEVRCEVESNPPPTITWSRPGQTQVRELKYFYKNFIFGF